MRYTVFVNDNFHYMDEAESHELGEFPTLDAAIGAAKKIVDDYLLSSCKPGMTAGALFRSYTAFGEDPSVIATPPVGTGILFSAWDYAKRRCDELCAGGGDCR